MDALRAFGACAALGLSIRYLQRRSWPEKITAAPRHCPTSFRAYSTAPCLNARTPGLLSDSARENRNCAEKGQRGASPAARQQEQGTSMSRTWLLPIAALAFVGAAATAQAAPTLGSMQAATAEQAGTVQKVHDYGWWRYRRHHDRDQHWRYHRPDHHHGWSHYSFGDYKKWRERRLHRRYYRTDRSY